MNCRMCGANTLMKRPKKGNICIHCSNASNALTVYWRAKNMPIAKSKRYKQYLLRYE